MASKGHQDHLESESNLTEQLLLQEKDAFVHATQCPFLTAAGQGKVAREKLSQWLSQDRLYAQTYIGFIGSLLARVHLPEEHTEDQETSLRWKTVNLLIGALKNIERELKFFAGVAKKYGLDLNYDITNKGPSPATEEYIHLFRSFAEDPRKSLLEGLLVLWATEKCYLAAWQYASSCSERPAEDDLDGGALRKEFLPNWTSTSFAEFVDDIARLTNEWARQQPTPHPDIQPYTHTFRRVLDIEKRFWPEIEQ